MSENGEPRTPREIVENNIALLSRDAFYIIQKLVDLRNNNPLAEEFLRKEHPMLREAALNALLLASSVEPEKPQIVTRR